MMKTIIFILLIIFQYNVLPSCATLSFLEDLIIGQPRHKECNCPPPIIIQPSDTKNPIINIPTNVLTNGNYDYPTKQQYVPPSYGNNYNIGNMFDTPGQSQNYYQNPNDNNNNNNYNNGGYYNGQVSDYNLPVYKEIYYENNNDEPFHTLMSSDFLYHGERKPE